MFVTIITAVVVTILLHWLLFLVNRPKNLPPGPLPLPLIGSAWVFMVYPTDKAFVYLRKHFGKLSTIYSGCSNNGILVVLADWDEIATVSNSRELSEPISNRPFDLNVLRGVEEGIIWGQWEPSRDRRKFIIRSLKQVGLDGSKITSHIVDETDRLFSFIAKQEGRAFDPDEAVTEALGSCLLLSVHSQRLDLQDPDCRLIFDWGKKFFEGTHFDMAMLPYLGFFKYFINDKMAEGERGMEKAMSKWLQAEIDRRKPTFNPEVITDVLDAYMAGNYEKSDHLKFNNFMRSMVDVFLGAMDTTAKTISWALFYLGHMPDEQERLYKEIESVVPSTSYPGPEHRKKLPRFEAFMQEAARYSAMTMTSFPKRCAAPVRFGPNKCYEIPENGTMWFEWYTQQFDKDYWIDPENFRVDRWLDPNDPTKVLEHTHVMQFGSGRRICPGEGLGRLLQNLFVAAFIQRFKWRMEKPMPLDSRKMLLTRIPVEHKLIFTARN